MDDLQTICRRLLRVGEIVGKSLASRARPCIFQIADDFLDVWGDDRRVGKTLGSDLAQGKATLPIIRALSVAEGSTRQALLKCIAPAESANSAGQLLELLEQTDARQYTLDRARQFVESATDALSILPASEARECLRRIAQFAIERKF